MNALRILAFESSAKAASVAITEDEKLLGEYFQNSGQTHSRTLMQMAKNLLENCDLTPQELDAVACAAGPGSFTGIRIGVAAAKGFAWGRELPLYGISTLRAMAYNAGCFTGLVLCAMDARREQVYNALFSCENGRLTRLCEDRAISVQELQQELATQSQSILLVGDGAELCQRLLDLPTLLAPQQLRHQRASGVALCAYVDACLGKPSDAALLTPSYLRLSQAERERLAREQDKKGD